MAERILGLDYGTRRVGVAVSDALGVAAHPVTVIDLSEQDLNLELAEIIAEYDVARIVIGLPVSLSGSEGEMVERVRAFAAEVAAATRLPVELYGEQFTTVEAERVLLQSGARRATRRRVRDKLAATVLLQGYLDATR